MKNISLLAIFLVCSHAEAKSVKVMNFTDAVQVCSIPLPVFYHANFNRFLAGTKHVYLRLNGNTFGTPFTAEGTYFGGDAYLYSEDLFARMPKYLKDEKCFPVMKPQDMTDEAFANKVECIANKMTVPKYSSHSDPARTWYPIFQYNGAYNNCSSMTHYLVNCGGGDIKKIVNYSVGDRVPLTTSAKIVSLDGQSGESISTYGEICEKALSECEGSVESELIVDVLE